MRTATAVMCQLYASSGNVSSRSRVSRDVRWFLLPLATAVPSLWQGELVEGAYRALSVRGGLPDLAGVVYRRRLPTGKTLAWNAGIAGGDAPTKAAVTFASRTHITDRFSAAAGAAGWQ